MEPSINNTPLVVILGQTVSGKSALAMDLAQRFDGEIIAADSRTVYKGMDIGTAKPTQADRRAVVHHLLDVVPPDQPFTVVDFQVAAKLAIEDIGSRGKVPFLVGGSGLYIDAVIYNFTFRQPADQAQRNLLQDMSVEQLQSEVTRRGLEMPNNRQNSRHLIRTLETGGAAASNTGLRPSTLVLGLSIAKDRLKSNIVERTEKMINDGFVDEVTRLSGAYDWSVNALQAPGYKAFRLYLAGQITLDEAKQRFVQNDLNYAKRQKTWFKRNKDIVWINNSAEAVDKVTTFLNKDM